MTLENIPFGFQDIYEGKADEAIENPQILARSGDASQKVELVDSKTIRLTVQGNGTVGAANAFAVQVDGHIGDGEAPIVVEFDYTVVSPDATEVSFTKTSREKIPV